MDICVWDRCNNKCLMCTNPDRPWPAWDGSFKYDYKSLIKRIKDSKDKIKEYDSIYLSGGEPTLHPQFLDVFKYLSDNFPGQRIKLLTNGRRFFYADFAKEFLQITNNLDINLSIYGPDKKIHDAVTRLPDSFEQTTKGLENLLRYKKDGQLIDIRFVITKLSYKHLDQFLEMAKEKFSSVDRIILIFPEIENQAQKNLKTIQVTYDQVKPYLEKIYPLFKKFKEVRLYHFPLCTISNKFWPYAWRTWPVKEVTFLPFCNQCRYKKNCVGLHKEYLKNIGRKDFNPIKKGLNIKKRDDFHHPIIRVEGKY